MTVANNYMGAPQRVLPANVEGFIAALIEGRVEHFALVFGDDANVYTCYDCDFPGSNKYRLLGQIAMLEHQLVRSMQEPQGGDHG